MLILAALALSCSVKPGARTAPQDKYSGAVRSSMQGAPAVVEASVALLNKRDWPALKGTSCAGTRIAGGLIVTVDHCLDAVARTKANPGVLGTIYWVSYQDWLEHGGDELAAPKQRAELLATDTVGDIAILRELSSPRGHVANVATSAPRQGDPVWTVGHPSPNAQLEFSFTSGIVAGPLRRFGDGYFTQFQGFVWYGSSGGGVFNANGELISAVSRLSIDPDLGVFVFGIYFGSHQQNLLRLLASVKTTK